MDMCSRCTQARASRTCKGSEVGVCRLAQAQYSRSEVRKRKIMGFGSHRALKAILRALAFILFFYNFIYF